MARIRSIKPEFFTSLTIAGLRCEARMTFIGLWTYADDEGRGVDDARLVRAAVWPLDDRTIAEVETDLAALSAAGLIQRYEAGGRRFLAVTSWAEHQRVDHPRASTIPAPTGIIRESLAKPRENLAPDRKRIGRGREEEGKGKEDAARDDSVDQLVDEIVRRTNREIVLRFGDACRPIPVGHGSRQNVLDWLAEGIPIAVIEPAIADRVRAYRPSGRNRQPNSMAYFDGAVRDAWEKHQLGDVTNGDHRNGTGGETGGGKGAARPDRFAHLTDSGDDG